MKRIENQTFDEERALYGSQELTVKNCAFDGPADGESALKECRKIESADCFFNLRYPFWHDVDLRITGCEMTGTDLSFERSEVEATILTPVDSVKNPRRGVIRAPQVGQIILDDPLAQGRVETVPSIP